MSQKEPIIQKLLQGLVYPSVLGTFIYEIVIRISQLIENDLSDFKPDKFLLVLAFVSFYCCDYLYSTLLKEYNLMNIILHIVTIFLLCIEFGAIHLTKAQSEVDVKTIIGCILLFLFIFLFYDIYLSKKKTDPRDKTFFKELWMWELGGVSLFLFLLFTSNYIDSLLVSYFIGGMMVIATIVYSYFLNKKLKMG